MSRIELCRHKDATEKNLGLNPAAATYRAKLGATINTSNLIIMGSLKKHVLHRAKTRTHNYETTTIFTDDRLLAEIDI